MRITTYKAGFTLIELSIVLAIIGLITGGIMMGQSLQRQSQINSAVMDEQRYVTAAQNFQQKYNSLPGDFATATSSWGAMSSCPPVSGSSTQSGTQTCNGTGNGQVVDVSTTPAGSANTFTNIYESFLFWQHLNNAQLIQGSYTGISGPGGSHTYDHVPGSNSPNTRLDNAGFGVAYEGVVTAAQGDANFFPANYGHIFVLGGYTPNNYPVGATFTTAEAAAIDTKYDDGVPAYGNILTWEASGYNANCATSSAVTATYKTTTAGKLCSLIFITGF